jgi:hypothetical protein
MAKTYRFFCCVVDKHHERNGLPSFYVTPPPPPLPVSEEKKKKKNEKFCEKCGCAVRVLKAKCPCDQATFFYTDCPHVNAVSKPHRTYRVATEADLPEPSGDRVLFVFFVVLRNNGIHELGGYESLDGTTRQYKCVSKALTGCRFVLSPDPVDDILGIDLKSVSKYVVKDFEAMQLQLKNTD